MKKPSIRRIIDVTAAATGLVFFGPLIATMIVLARWETGEPGLFRQRRYGLRGEPFTIYKIHNLDKNLNPLPLSGWFRRYGLDELPQLFNLLKGDMSIVGPRPHISVPNVPGWVRTLDVPPGLTGLNAVLEKAEGIEHDLEQRADIENRYIDSRSSLPSTLSMDMRIIFRTARLVCAGRIDAGKYPSARKDARGDELKKFDALGYK